MLAEDVLSLLSGLREEQRREIEEELAAEVLAQRFVPTSGPQSDAYYSRADLLLYGGQAGGGKTGLLCGLALEEHQSSLIMRRQYSDMEGVGGIIEELLKLYGSRSGFNGSPPATLRFDGRVITFGAAKNIGDEESYQGRARDLLGLDEAAQFAESQVKFLRGWVRSTSDGQRCRTVLASNPPIKNTGDWLIGMFRPWLDVTHPKPAKPGELRWYVTDLDGKDMEVDGPEPVDLGGKRLEPQSRTFIPASTADNPFLAGTGYDSTLDALPEPLRSAMRDGQFMLARSDSEWQVIPTQWIREAQARWTENPPEHCPMSCIGVDVAQGGADKTILAPRYDGWFAPFVAVPGVETPGGPDVAGLVLANRKNGCSIVVDMGGGWGGSAYDHLRANIGTEPLIRYVGAEGTSRRTVDQTLGFHNKRAEAYWRLREALDPGQDGGSLIALPDDPELVSDLTTPQFSTLSGKIKITTKQDVVKELGRSPDKGDAVVMSWFGGPRLKTHGNAWRNFQKGPAGGGKVNVIRGRRR